jgi:hypothetical protein
MTFSLNFGGSGNVVTDPGTVPRRGRRSAFTQIMAPDQIRDVIVNRAGMRFLLRDAELRQQFEDFMRRNLQLSGQLVYADFAHS